MTKKTARKMTSGTEPQAAPKKTSAKRTERRRHLVDQFAKEAYPIEEAESLLLFEDKRTGAIYFECHIKASRLVELATTDVPLDPDDQSEYRANREIVGNHVAFEKMKDDALKGRTFSNIVAEYTKTYKPKKPIKIIGGQHRFEAIKDALNEGVDENQGLKIYIDLNQKQKLDVQLISNTNIAVSPDLFDRMQETVRGPQLRDWCQEVGFLEGNQDFTDRFERGGPVSVQIVRTFILNYYAGLAVGSQDFDSTNTTPKKSARGQHDSEWEELISARADLWADDKLKEAAKEFALLIEAQREAFEGKKGKPDYPEKAFNMAILSAWAFVAGLLQKNTTRLHRHYSLPKLKKKDPLNAEALAKGRHKSDPDNYRGLGYRTDPKERGRFVELFYYQAEKGDGINKRAVDVAIAKYHAKQAKLEALKLQEKDL